MATDPITKEELIDAATDAELIESVSNDLGTSVTRFGDTVKNIRQIMLELATYDDKGAWATSTVYAIKDLVQESGITYICTVAHTSGTFATDLAAGKDQHVHREDDVLLHSLKEAVQKGRKNDERNGGGKNKSRLHIHGVGYAPDRKAEKHADARHSRAD